MKVLGIESSCDETAAAVIEKGKVLSSVISSQIDIHKKYGGVVPELASRAHVENIDGVINKALEDACTTLDNIDLIAVTQGPGLVGALLVGLCAAKSIAWAKNIPLVPINHIQGHLESVFMSNSKIKLPSLNLVVSGGHTSLYYVEKRLDYRLIGQTRNDAVGEAFDKVSKIMGLGYPGGPIIEKFALIGNEKAVKFPISRMSDNSLDFSFSGIKSAVVRYVENNNIPLYKNKKESQVYHDISASFQKTVLDDILEKCERAVREYNPYSFCVSGGVSVNSYLRSRFSVFGDKKGLNIYFPEKELTTDNAAMIAYTGYLKRNEAKTVNFKLNAYANLKL